VALLNENLEETSRTMGREPSSFIAGKVYQLSDGTFALFGQQISLSGRLSQSKVSRADAVFQNATTISVTERPNRDSGQLSAVSQLDVENEFVVAQSIFRDGVGQDVRVGVAVDILKFK
jgi:hypothetical protein